MMMSRDHETYAEDLAPYVLGALPPLEAEVLEKHMRRCGDCQRELAELRTGAEALARSVASVEAPDSLRERMLAEVAEPRAAGAAEAIAAHSPAGPEGTPSEASPAREREESGRRLGLGGLLGRLRPQPAAARAPSGLWSRPAFAALAVGLVATVAGVGGWSLGRTQDGADRTLAAEVDRSRLPGVDAELTMRRRGDDAVVRLAGLRSLGARGVYEIWVERDGKIVPGPTFSPTRQGAALAGIPESLAGADAVYITRERPGGAMTPSETPVVSVPLGSS